MSLFYSLLVGSGAGLVAAIIVRKSIAYLLNKRASKLTTEVREIPYHPLFVAYLNGESRPIPDEMPQSAYSVRWPSGDFLKSYRFALSGGASRLFGINPLLVAKIELPTLDYTNTDVLMMKVHLYTGKSREHILKEG